jgi:putative tributyrin esterase
MSQFFTTEKAHLGDLQHITVKSNALRQRADITVYVPKEMDEIHTPPLVILLHGVYGSHWAWAAKGNAHITVERLVQERKIRPMILAMPSDGLWGDGSAYVPHKTENYEQWIVEEVIAVMKEQFPTLGEDPTVFIAGLSMGGFGALRLGAKYPKVFTAFSGLSSITHFSQMKHFVADFEALSQRAQEKDGVLDWMLYNRHLLPPFRFDCGTDDVLIAYNRQLHSELITQQIEHLYEEFPGEHSWSYWTKYLENTLLFFQNSLK